MRSPINQGGARGSFGGMRRRCIEFSVFFYWSQLSAPAAEARIVTDSAGRKVDVPDRIDKVFAAGPPASILLYMLAPEKMTGWPNPPTPRSAPSLLRNIATCPRSGG